MALVDEKEIKEPVIVDPFAGSIEALATEELDKQADAYEVVKPPKAGIYDVKIVVAKDGYKMKEIEDTKEKYYSIDLELYIINSSEENNGAIVNSKVSTYIGRGKKISTLAWLMLKTGYPETKIPSSIDHGTLLTKAAHWFKDGNKQMKSVVLDWKAWSKEAKKFVFLTMKDFPSDASGEPEHIVRYKHNNKGSVSTEELYGRLNLISWENKKGTSGPNSASRPIAPTPAAKPIIKVKPLPPIEEIEEQEEIPTPVVKAKTKAKPPVEDVDDILNDVV